jgi:hypothetical protein
MDALIETFCLLAGSATLAAFFFASKSSQRARIPAIVRKRAGHRR